MLYRNVRKVISGGYTVSVCFRTAIYIGQRAGADERSVMSSTVRT